MRPEDGKLLRGNLTGERDSGRTNLTSLAEDETPYAMFCFVF